MKYFFDTEFIEDGKTIDLISIGIVSEDDREYYALNLECDWGKASKWVKENVIEHLPLKPPLRWVAGGRIDSSHAKSVGWRFKDSIATEIIEFCSPQSYGEPEFWAYYADYDWVVFCQLFGTMMELPKGFPMYCRDVKQLCDEKGNPQLPKQESVEHHALNDARWTKQAYLWLRNQE
ncbi:3'-5' exoribonuclease [Synechococcus elongatus IITB4]|uniref:3'-5' exoribonuclease domain-containing protein n=1 Tax=Synechococcus elongatus TaxID=32046 RepID=UPI0030D322B9